MTGVILTAFPRLGNMLPALLYYRHPCRHVADEVSATQSVGHLAVQSQLLPDAYFEMFPSSFGLRDSPHGNYGDYQGLLLLAFSELQ